MTSLFTPRGLWRELTPGDRLVSVAVLAAGFALTGLARVPAAEPTRAVILVAGEIVASLPLGAPAETTVAGRLGPVTVAVRDRAARVTESACPHRICVAMGAKRRTGEMIACVPNALVVRIEGGAAAPGTPDAVSR